MKESESNVKSLCRPRQAQKTEAHHTRNKEMGIKELPYSRRKKQVRETSSRAYGGGVG